MSSAARGGVAGGCAGRTWAGGWTGVAERVPRGKGHSRQDTVASFPGAGRLNSPVSLALLRPVCCPLPPCRLRDQIDRILASDRALRCAAVATAAAHPASAALPPEGAIPAINPRAPAPAPAHLHAAWWWPWRQRLRMGGTRRRRACGTSSRPCARRSSCPPQRPPTSKHLGPRQAQQVPTSEASDDI